MRIIRLLAATTVLGLAACGATQGGMAAQGKSDALDAPVVTM